MTKLNGAYTRFYDIIESHSSIKKLAVSFSTPSEWDDWLFSCYITKACINADFFAADLIIEPFKKAYKHAQLSNNNYIGQYVMDLEGFEGNVFSRPTYTLHRFGMFEEWKESRKITHYFYDRIIKDQVPDEYGDILTSSYFGDTMIKNLTEDNFNKTIPRLVIRHIEQAKNSYRLEKIDSKRFKSLMKRFNVRSVEKQSYFDDIDNFIKNNDFFVEVNDYKYKKDIMKGNIIRDVSFKQKRYHHLTPQQKWEYLKTFNEKKDSQLIDKYLFIRSQDIMLGIINNFEKIDRNILKNEIQFFAKNEECSAHIEFQNLIEMIKYLESLDKKHRREVCQILSELDNEEYEENNMSITIGLDYEINPEFIISSNDDYIEFAQTDLKTLKIYQQTGRLPDVHINDWNNALSNIEKLEKTKIGKRYNDVWLQVKTPSPDLIIETAKPYLEELLKIGKKINPKYTGELQIGYVINRLTIAYAKQKDWEQVRYWGELFFNLPMRYRSRSNNSEKEVLRKRIERAISQMGK